MKIAGEKIITGKGATLHLIPTKKYKTISIAVKLQAPLERETITARALLPYVLQQGTASLSDARALRLKLDDLYGAILSISGTKKGEKHIITLRLDVANENYLSDRTPLFERAVNLLREILFEPKVENGAFTESIVSRETQTLKQKMVALKDDKMSYANMRLIDEMCKDESYSLHVHGYEEELKDMDGSKLYGFYEKMLKQDKMDIYILGDVDSELAEKAVQPFLERDVSPIEERAASVHSTSADVQEVIETQDVQQAKLHLGYRTNIRYDDSDYAALQVFNGLFGGFPSSKLFRNVREKHSLAYYAASRFESHKGLLFVFSGIDPKDYQKAKEIIDAQLASMQAGEFEGSEVEEVKDLIVSQILETIDNPAGHIETLYQQVMGNKNITIEQMLDTIQQVTTEDVLQVAKKVQLDTVYLLTNKEAEKNA
ncbi:EF-P 5-aminopentanol modification-associated protein YfmF [Terribacillus saccharophilus]|uniref:Peptidase M16 n=1 Tax=Terribacillus saccharophilus TaxID=361277 RepID=A0ABX4H3B8_9BACI|nr:pitrilysin family protein [Terribacillus saccharophilus]PAD37064.1 peptidase M16 [Terribacillus saccharophilus]PAD97540.1 peptidase M16 [Terribacillus saccharophilus]PAE01589.1 peptidase M16 [Terribacillus saccharophilus]